MDYVGLIFKYPVNRPIAQFEKELQLKQNVKLEVEPLYQLSVIKINTTYLEMIDKFYSWKGALTAFISIPFFMILTLYFAVHTIAIPRIIATGQWHGDTYAIIFINLLSLSFLYWLFKYIKKESFSFTHYPIRLNRNTRMVYVFRTNGTVLTVPWDDAFFTLGMAGGTGLIQNWDLRAHVLDKDKKTVLETFTFGMVSNRKEDLYQLWEFIRRYMEEGPQEAYQQVKYCMPVWDRRESYIFGLKRLIVNFNGQPFLQLLMMPFLLWYSIGRFIAMHTSKIPKWPQEVEDACRVGPGDPYTKDWRSNQK